MIINVAHEAYIICNEKGKFLNPRNGKWEAFMSPKNIYYQYSKACKVANCYNGIVKSITVSLSMRDEENENK